MEANFRPDQSRSAHNSDSSSIFDESSQFLEDRLRILVLGRPPGLSWSFLVFVSGGEVESLELPIKEERTYGQPVTPTLFPHLHAT